MLWVFGGLGFSVSSDCIRSLPAEEGYKGGAGRRIPCSAALTHDGLQPLTTW